MSAPGSPGALCCPDVSPLPVVTGARLAPQRYADTTLTSVALADTMSAFDGTVLLTAVVSASYTF